MSCQQPSPCPASRVPDAWALALQYRPLAYTLAGQFARRNNMRDRLEDLRQEALLGLHHGAELFDPERGLSFASWGSHWALYALQRAAQDLSDAPVKVTRRAYYEGVRTRAVPFDAPAGNDDRPLSSTLPSQDRWLARVEASVDAARLMARASVQSFKPRNVQGPRSQLRDVEAFYRVAQEESGEEIGAEAHVSRERVRQLAERGGALLRKVAAASR